MKKLFYKLYLKYKGIPHRNHVKSVVDRRQIINGMKRDAAKLYIEGMEINEIGVEIGVTRERVRQLLISVVR
jgi:hypothetical protein